MDEEVTTPKPVLSKRQLCRGFTPLEPQKGLFNLLAEIDKNYLACTPGNSLFNKVLTDERVAAGKAYKAKQARIVGLPVTPSPSIILPPPGMVFTQAIPTVHSGIIQRHGRGDPPLLITGMLPQLVGCSTLQRVEWYDSCSITEPEFLALVNEA